MKYNNLSQRIIAFLFCLFVYVSLFAQSMSVSEQLDFNMKVLQAVEQYERCITRLSKPEYEYKWLDLFESSEVEVYNDLLGVSSSPVLSAKEYVQLMKDKTDNQFITLRNLKKMDTFKSGSSNYMKVSCQKELEYNNECEVMFSSNDYYGKDHMLIFTFIWNSEKSEAKITKIEGSMESSKKPLEDNYVVFQRTDNRDNQLLADGHKMVFDKFEQAFLPPSCTSTEAFIYKADADTRIRLMCQNRECRIYTMAYKPIHWRVKPWGSIAVGGFASLQDGLDIYGLDKKSSSEEFGVSIGYILCSKPKFKLGFNLGFGLSIGKIDFDYHMPEYHYTTNEDIDGDEYIRYYNGLNLRQTYQTKSLCIPVYFDIELPFSPIVSAYVNLGAKVYKKQSSSFDSNTKVESIYGLYEKYDNLVIGANAGINGFVDEDMQITSVPYGELTEKDVVPDLLLGVGARISLTNDWLLDVGISWQKSFSPIYEGCKDIRSDSGLITYSRINKMETVNNLASLYGKCIRQALMVNLGFAYKF